MRKTLLFLLIPGVLWQTLFLYAAAPASGMSSETLKVHVVLEVVPIRVKPLTDGKAVDALERSPEEMGPTSQVVIFRIHRVLRGELQRVKMPQLSVWDQAKNAADDKNILKLVTMDFKRPEEDQEKEWFSMVVADPWKSFGLKENEDSPRQHYRIGLARVQNNPESFILVESQKL